MARDVIYTNGVIAAREKYLLKDKIFKMCESGAEEALRTLVESGFGKSAEISSVYDYEQLVAADEASIDAFIREYSPSAAEAEYLLAPRDFHNAKALIKAHYLGIGIEKLLAPEGLVPIQTMLQCIENGNFSKLGKHLGGALSQAALLFAKEGENATSGAEIGIIFEKAQYAHLKEVCSKNSLLKKLLAVKADMTNILTTLRSGDFAYASKCFVSGGKLTEKQLSALLSDDKEKASKALDGTPYSDFVKKCFADRAEGLPMTQAERVYESYEAEYFAKNKYDLQANQPFLYYVFRRRAENSNVRILFVCLLAGMKDSEIKSRLR